MECVFCGTKNKNNLNKIYLNEYKTNKHKTLFHILMDKQKFIRNYLEM